MRYLLIPSLNQVVPMKVDKLLLNSIQPHLPVEPLVGVDHAIKKRTALSRPVALSPVEGKALFGRLFLVEAEG